MQEKQTNEKEVYRAAKLRELINKKRQGDGVPTHSNDVHLLNLVKKQHVVYQI